MVEQKLTPHRIKVLKVLRDRLDGHLKFGLESCPGLISSNIKKQKWIVMSDGHKIFKDRWNCINCKQFFGFVGFTEAKEIGFEKYINGEDHVWKCCPCTAIIKNEQRINPHSGVSFWNNRESSEMCNLMKEEIFLLLDEYCGIDTIGDES